MTARCVLVRGQLLPGLLVLGVFQAPQAGIAQSARGTSRGSFAATALFASAGSLLGIVVASPLVHVSGGCPTVPGAKCGANNNTMLYVVGASLAGAATGAVLGRQLTHGRQSIVRSIGGALLGGMVGGALVSYLGRHPSDAAVTVTFVVPQGVFAALVGW